MRISAVTDGRDRPSGPPFFASGTRLKKETVVRTRVTVTQKNFEKLVKFSKILEIFFWKFGTNGHNFPASYRYKCPDMSERPTAKLVSDRSASVGRLTALRLLLSTFFSNFY